MHRLSNLEFMMAKVQVQAAFFRRAMWPSRHTAQRAKVREHIATQRASREELIAATIKAASN